MSDTRDGTVPWDGQPYSVKRHGVTLTNCDSEPVQTPGCIQAHGALLVVRTADLTIVQVSENSARWLGAAPAELLGNTIDRVLGKVGDERLRTFLRQNQLENNPLYLLTLPATRSAPPLDVTVHSTGAVAIVEFEATDRSSSAPPDYLGLLKGSLDRLQTTQSLREFSEVMTREVQALTGLDRVMVYRFHEDGHGEVFAETHRAGLPSWLGLHYPAEDIPLPARAIFRQTWLRPVPDVGGELAELVPLTNPDTGEPLPMTHCVLRAPSIMYTEYLQNMGVTAALTLSIRRQDQLWGLIAAHHYADSAFLPYPVRAACEFFAQAASLLHRAAQDREELASRNRIERLTQELIARTAGSGDLSGLIDRPDLLEVFGAGGAAVRERGRWFLLGTTPSETQLDALASWLRAKLEHTHDAVFATDSLTRVYPPAESFAEVASGVLAMTLSRAPDRAVMWFRPERVHDVTWGGNPHDKPTVAGPNGPRLTPRQSFNAYIESVRLSAVPWTTLELESAARFRVLAVEMVVGQAARLAQLNETLARTNDELDAFAYIAGHDLKEPLRAIHRYAHQLLEEQEIAVDRDKEKLLRLLRLTARMDGLLDSLLDFSRSGRASVRLEDVDVGEVLAEAIEVVDARKAERPAEIVSAASLPRLRCDWVLLREILVNLLSNALKYNDKPMARVEVGFVHATDAMRPHAPPATAGLTILYVRDNGIGIDPQRHEQVFTLFKRLHNRDEYGGGAGAGLTITKKLVERHGGNIWVESQPGVGSTFYFTLEGARDGASPSP